jgi:Ca-activated chloride channel family protein
MNPMDFTFANPAALNWAWAVLALLALVLIRTRGRARAMAAFADAPLLRTIAPRANSARPFVRALLTVAALAVLVPALMDPRWGAQVEEVKRRGADVFFVMDVSRSMTAQDATPDRLSRARQFVEETVESLGGDRIGLIEFAGTAAMRVPLTLNYGAFRTTLAELVPLSGARGGTALANAIIIISDGEDLDDGDADPVATAKEVLEKDGVHVYAIGIGDSREGARIPESRGKDGVRYLVFDGQEVWTKLDERVLRETALAGGGAFIPAGTGRVDMARAYAQTVGALERKEFEDATVTRRTPRFQWFAGLAFIVLLVGSMIPARRAPKAEGIPQ